MCRTFTNARTNEVVTTTLSNAEITAEFANVAHEKSWLWFWLVKSIQEAQACGRYDVEFFGDLLLFAIGMGLKRPMIRLHNNGRRYKLYLSQRGTLCIKTGALIPNTHDPIGDEEYLGCIWQGKFLASKDRTPLPVDREFLDNLTADPVKFMADRSKDMCRCCYCGRALEDQRSKAVGYGPDCAEHWGLPWGETTNEKMPSFAQLWARSMPDDIRSIRALCRAIRKTPGQQLEWDALSDVMEDGGYVFPIVKGQTKRLTAPARTVTVPAF
jgi:hypothetical protein